MSKEYLAKRMSEFEEFKKKVKDEGSPLIKIALNDEWFDNVKEGAEKVWGGDGTVPYQCKFFPYRWLCEEKQWEFVNTELKKIDQLTHRKQMLRNTVLKITSEDWMVAHAAALEINSLCKFMHDGVLIDIEPKITSDREFRSDALIKVDQNEILIELTAITKSFGDPVKTRVITLSVEQLKNQVLNKIKEKAEKQLSFASQPSILIISLIVGFSADPMIAKWAIEAILNLYPKINAFMVSDNLFQYGHFYFNDQAEYNLSEKEVEYFLNP